MSKKPTEKAPREGKCFYCNQVFPKAAIARHLKSCSERTAAWAKTASAKSARPGRLMHIAVEGRHAPEYWLHLELPSDTLLSELDYFLRDIWLECCGHLSQFTIEGKRYEATPDYDDDFDLVLGELDEAEIGLDDLDDEDDEFLLPLTPEAEQAADEFYQNRSDPAAKEKLRQALSKMYGKEVTPQEMDLIALMAELSDQIEDDFLENDADVPLASVLRPGLKFTHEYDFGSTTELTLKVVEEREGHYTGDDLWLMAQNEPPVIPCGVCGKPAVVVCTQCFDDESWLCETCAPNHPCGTELFLPVVNSPRVGVCGYTGDAEDWYDADWDEDARDGAENGNLN